MRRNYNLAILFLATTVLFALFTGSVKASDDDDDDDDDAVDAKSSDGAVAVLDDKNVEDFLKKNKAVFVEFYAPWCGHCKSLAPKWDEAAEKAKKANLPVVFAKLDADANKDAAKKYGVEGFPTLKLFLNGTPHPFEGEREADAMVEWVRDRVSPPKELKTVDDAKAFLKDNKVSAFVLVADSIEDGSKGRAVLDGARFAASQMPTAFVSKDNADVIKHLGVKGKAPVAVLKRSAENFETTHVEFDGDSSDEKATLEWLRSERVPRVIPYSRDFARDIFDAKIKKQFIFLGSKEDNADEFAVVNEVAKTHRDAVIYVSIPESESGVLDFFQMKKEDLPSFVAVDMEDEMKVYKPKKVEFKKDTLQAFADDLVKGKLERFLKSAAEPEDPLEDGVHVVVGKSFKKVVLDEEKDVFLEVYAPWCGHCKALEPKWKKLAKRVKDVDSLVIAKMDGTENEADGLKVEGFPTIYLYPAGGAEPIKYDGKRTIKAMLKFLKKNAAKKFKLPKKNKKASKSEKEEL